MHFAALHSGLVMVRGTGRAPGEPPEVRERSFERFFRCESDGKASGTGLGLAIVKVLVEAGVGAWAPSEVQLIRTDLSIYTDALFAPQRALVQGRI